jgi:hypothetical protein
MDEWEELFKMAAGHNDSDFTPPIRTSATKKRPLPEAASVSGGGAGAGSVMRGDKGGGKAGKKKHKSKQQGCGFGDAARGVAASTLRSAGFAFAEGPGVTHTSTSPWRSRWVKC